MRRGGLALVASSLAVVFVACGGPSPNSSGAGYAEYECSPPIGKIIREDCSKSALRYEGVSIQGSVGAGGVGASGSYRDHAVREADSLVAMLKEQRVALCNDFNTCKMTVPAYQAERERIDDSFIALLALKDKMAAMDADAAAKVLGEIKEIRSRRRRGSQVASVTGPWLHIVNGTYQQLVILGPANPTAVAGTVEGAGGSGTWTLEAGTLTLRWPNGAAPGGAWIDTVAVAADGRAYDGTNNVGARIRGYSANGSDGWFLVKAKHSGKCMEVLNGGAGTEPVSQNTCQNGQNQQWRIVRNGDGFFNLEARHSGKCLDVANASMTTARLYQYDCHRGPNQQFSITPTADGTMRITARHSGKCLDVANASMEVADVNQYECHGGPNQQWVIVEAGR